MAAVLACGEGAVLSHTSAAALWGLRPSASSMIDVTVPGRGGRRPQAGIRLHRSSLTEADVTTRDRIPTTTPARTLLDAAGVFPAAGLRRAVAQAQALGVFDFRSFTAVVRGHPNAKGRGALVEILDEGSEMEMTRSELEAKFLGICRTYGIERPSANRLVAGYEVDFVWVRKRVIVETDGFRHHRSRNAFEEDRRRDATLTAAGYRVFRFTYRQISREPAEVAALIRAALAASASA